MFYNCIEGEGTEIVCPNGLHFDEYAGTCAWPDTAGRTGCGEPDDSKISRTGRLYGLTALRSVYDADPNVNVKKISRSVRLTRFREAV